MLNNNNVYFWEKIHSSNNLGLHRNNDYNARCDICGDSKTHNDKKRLHLFRKDSYTEDMVKCFNCGYTSNMYNYIKNHHQEYLQEYKSKTSKEIFQSLLPKKKSKEYEIKALDDIGIDLDNIPKTFFDLSKFLKKASYYKDASKYILSRGGNPEDFYFCEETLEKLDPKLRSLKNYIIYPFLYSDKTYGFYSRNIYEKSFKTYVPESNTGFKLADYFKIDLDKEVFIFEGIFCKLCSNLENSIAMCGANIPEDLLKKLKNPVFVYDNDKRGLEESKKIVKKYKNAKVCLWFDDKEYNSYKDINEIFTEKLRSKNRIKEFILNHLDFGFTAETRLSLI